MYALAHLRTSRSIDACNLWIRVYVYVSSRKVKRLTFDRCERLEKVRVYSVSHMDENSAGIREYFGVTRSFSEMIKRNIRIFLANNLR